MASSILTPGMNTSRGTVPGVPGQTIYSANVTRMTSMLLLLVKEITSDRPVSSR